MLCNNLEGQDGVGGGRVVREGGDICADVWQKPTQCCNAITLQLKINTFLKKEVETMS